MLPLFVHGELYGCLRVGSYAPGFYQESHFHVARAFAERITQALWNARLYQLEQTRARAAEQLAALRSDLVDAVSHELRTPLTAMLGYGELLQSRWSELSDTERRAKVDRMVLAADRQQQLIENLLRVSGVESWAPAMQREAVQLASVVTRAVDLVRESLSHPACFNRPARLHCSPWPTRRRSCRSSLISYDNAAKYSTEGSPIEVTWEQKDTRTSIRVRDHGPGIPGESLGYLFTRFGRVPGSRMQSGHVGTGLGLYLGRQLAEAMGGALDLEYTGTTGSVFCLQLPAQVDGRG